jgi:hypothetical protein
VSGDPINSFDLDGNAKCPRFLKGVCRKAKRVANVALQVVAVPTYAAYYATYHVRTAIPKALRWTNPALIGLAGTEAAGLGGDIVIDYLKRKTGSRERLNDEGVRGGIFPRWFLHGGPRVYLPGWRRRGGVDFA